MRLWHSCTKTSISIWHSQNIAQFTIKVTELKYNLRRLFDQTHVFYSLFRHSIQKKIISVDIYLSFVTYFLLCFVYFHRVVYFRLHFSSFSAIYIWNEFCKEYQLWKLFLRYERKSIASSKYNKIYYIWINEVSRIDFLRENL